MNDKETPAEKFDRLFSFEESAFRLEALPHYEVDGNPRFQAYCAGDPIENMHAQEWCENIRHWTQKGKSIQRVRLINEDRGAYFNFEVEACYPHNVQSGEEIYMLEESIFNKKFDLTKSDVWLLDESRVLQMEYNDDSKFLDCHVQEEGVDKILSAKRKLLREAVSFKEYLQNRRQRKI
jgi:hypothetical protein